MVETIAGRNYTAKEYAAWLKDVGFRDPHRPIRGSGSRQGGDRHQTVGWSRPTRSA
jgi:hypothetical protein